MKTSIEVKKFNGFKSYSLVINDKVTNYWDTDKTVIEQFKNSFDNSSELQKIAKDSIKKYNHFDNCTFISPKYLLNLPIEIININEVTEYWDMEKLIGIHNIVEIFSVSTPYQVDKTGINKDFVMSKLSEQTFTQLDRLYNKTGKRANKLVCFVFNYGYHFSTIFN